MQAFAETPDHALWIGTTNGLVRFDGSRFRYYQRENTPALRADSVFCLTVTRDGTLWIGVEGGGLVRYRDGKFREFTASTGSPTMSSAPSLRIATAYYGWAPIRGSSSSTASGWFASMPLI